MVAIAGLYLGGVIWDLGARFADTLLLFFVAWLIAFILTPVVNFVMRRRPMPHALAVGLVSLAVLIGLAVIGSVVLPPTFDQLNQLGQSMPAYVLGLPDTLDQAQSWLDERRIAVDIKALFGEQGLVQRAETWGTTIAQNTLSLARELASAVVASILVLIVSFYIMLDGERLSQTLIEAVPRRYRAYAHYVIDNVDRSFGGYLRGSFIIAVIYGMGTAAVMWWQGLSFVFPVSVFAGLMMFIPFIGSFFAILPPLIIVLFSGSLAKIVLVLIALLVLQQVVLQVIGPKVLSQSVGIHPLLVILALLLGAKVAGIWGLLFGVPVMAVICSIFVLVNQRVRTQEVGVPVSQGESDEDT